MTEESIKGWVEGAVRQDEFKVRVQNPDDIPTDDERHSVSVIDIFTSFNETINRIVKLNWDNDLHYAKFMTALARAVSNGLAHYCDLVEQKFVKEMDRMSPEQEATVGQTRQERWMQMAKDAWNNKEKIEPFQFFPTVCRPVRTVMIEAHSKPSPLSSSTTLSSPCANSTNWKRRSMSTHVLM